MTKNTALSKTSLSGILTSMIRLFIPLTVKNPTFDVKNMYRKSIGKNEIIRIVITVKTQIMLITMLKMFKTRVK